MPEQLPFGLAMAQRLANNHIVRLLYEVRSFACGLVCSMRSLRLTYLYRLTACRFLYPRSAAETTESVAG